MVGRDIGNIYGRLTRNENFGDIILRVENLSSEKVENISFDLKKGEILGFAGLVGAGRSETMMTIFGDSKKTSGNIFIDGKEVNIKSPKDAIKFGIGLCPEDRKEQGLILERTVKENMTVSILKTISNNSVINRNKEVQLSNDAVNKLKVKTPTIEKAVIELSGGNQQKVILARWLLSNLKVLILDEPTKGIDVGVKAEFYQMICDLAKSGMGIILISSELPEIINLSDRVIVMSEGKISGELKKEELSEEVILKAAMRFV